MIVKTLVEGMSIRANCRMTCAPLQIDEIW